MHLLRAMADDFRTLRAAKALPARATEPARRKDIKRALEGQRGGETRKVRLLDEFARHQGALSEATRRMQSMRDLKALLLQLDAAARPLDASPECARARRVLRMATISAVDRAQAPST